jgi:hypothetical protein
LGGDQTKAALMAGSLIHPVLAPVPHGQRDFIPLSLITYKRPKLGSVSPTKPRKRNKRGDV